METVFYLLVGTAGCVSLELLRLAFIQELGQSRNCQHPHLNFTGSSLNLPDLTPPESLGVLIESGVS